jgi:hypothetical protein
MGLSTAGIMIDVALTEDPRALLHRIGVYPREPMRDDIAENQMNPEAEEIAVVGFRSATIVYDWKLAEELIEDPKGPITAKVLAAFPGRRVLGFALVSSTSYWGFALFEGAGLRRRAAGEGNDIVLNEGEPLPEEDPARYLSPEDLESDWQGEMYLGADIVNELFLPFIGHRIEGNVDDDLQDEAATAYLETPAAVFRR